MRLIEAVVAIIFLWSFYKYLVAAFSQAIRDAEVRGERRGLQRAADKLERLATFGCRIKEAEGHIRHMMIETK